MNASEKSITLYIYLPDSRQWYRKKGTERPSMLVQDFDDATAFEPAAAADAMKALADSGHVTIPFQVYTS